MAIIFVVLFASALFTHMDKLLSTSYHCSISDISFEECVLVWEEDVTVKNVEVRPPDLSGLYISGVIYKPVKISSDDRELLEHLVQKEAGTEGLEGKRRVTDVVLNRVNSPKFPNSITEVIFQPNQFESAVHDDFLTRKVDSETTLAVSMELNGERLDGESLYFATKPLTRKGLYQYKRHYFSY